MGVRGGWTLSASLPSPWEGSFKTEMKAEYCGKPSTQTVRVYIIDSSAYQKGANYNFLTLKSKNFEDMLLDRY